MKKVTELCEYANDLARKVIQAKDDEYNGLNVFAKRLHNMAAELRLANDLSDTYKTHLLYSRINKLIKAHSIGVQFEVENAEEYAFKDLRAECSEADMKLLIDLWVKDDMCEYDTGFFLGAMEVVKIKQNMVFLKSLDDTIKGQYIHRHFLLL
jgi:hypothetical protein